MNPYDQLVVDTAPMVHKTFFTPEKIVQSQTIESTRGKLLMASCCSGNYLAAKVVERYKDLLSNDGSHQQIEFLTNLDIQFSDTETCVRLESHIGGYDVFLFQSLLNPLSRRSIDENYMAFLIAARAFRDHGARHVTGVLPYLAYARQDKPTEFKREPTTAKLLADLSIEAGIDRLVTWNPHSNQLRGFYGHIPVEMLSALNLFVDEFRAFQGRDDVIVVAPDAGASKFVTHFGRALDLKCAIASKYRPRPEEATISEVIGDINQKRKASVLDDMISSGGTIYELVKKLVTEKSLDEIYLGVSHNLCMSTAYERLWDLYNHYNLKKVIVTNSIPQTPNFLQLSFFSVKCLSDTFSRTINRIHYNQSVSKLFDN
ncbi:MAG: ribose-phosphate diphosphokinase [Chloroflexota bacterium]